MILLVLSLFAFLEAILTKSYVQAEKRLSEQQVAQAVNFFDENINNLKKTSFDYSRWDEPYKYMLGQNEGFIESQISESFYENIRVNALLFIDKAGKKKYARSRDYELREERMFDESFLDDFQPDSQLEKIIQSGETVSGVIMESGLPYIFSANPIYKTSGEGPMAGTFILFRELNISEIGRLAKISRLQLNIVPIEKAAIEYKELENKDYAANSRFVKPFNRHKVGGYALISDVFGQPSLILRVLSDRDLYKQGVMTIYYILSYVIIFSAFFCIAMIIYFKRIFVDKIGKLSEFTGSIDMNSKTKPRIEIKGTDEISQLSENINKMISSIFDSNIELEKRTKKVVDSEKELRRTVDELEKFNRIAVNRELKMVELKKKLRQEENK
jgi:sensor domain CHASE-containing protein